MYLHVGNDVVVHHPDVIGIFDLENTSVSKYTKEYLRVKQQDKRVIDVYDPKDALGALMVVLAIDAEKCSRNN